jgi:hypothetical protein
MTDTVATTGGNVPLEKLVRIYIKMRGAKEKMVKEHEGQIAKIDSDMQTVKQALLGYCKDHNVESVRTREGVFYRSMKRRYWTNDWEAMGRFIVEHNVPELLEKRLHQGNTQTFMEQNPDLLPPGLNVDSEFTITIRRS